MIPSARHHTYSTIKYSSSYMRDNTQYLSSYVRYTPVHYYTYVIRPSACHHTYPTIKYSSSYISDNTQYLSSYIRDTTVHHYTLVIKPSACHHTHPTIKYSRSYICDNAKCLSSYLDDNNISLFCRISSLLQGSFAKETYNCIDPTIRRQNISTHPYVATPVPIITQMRHYGVATIRRID